MERTIRVTGRANISIKPDTTRLHIELMGKRKEYSEAVKASTDDTQALQTVLAPLGFKKQDIRTRDFYVDQDRDDVLVEGNWKKILVGYRYNHSVIVEFPSDNVLLGKMLCSLTNSGLEPEFNIEFTFSDMESVKNKVIALAVSDARKKAEIMAAAAGVRLGDIVTINYPSQGDDYYERTNFRLASTPCLMKEITFDLDIEPDELKAEDSVSVIWEIE